MKKEINPIVAIALAAIGLLGLMLFLYRSNFAGGGGRKFETAESLPLRNDPRLKPDPRLGLAGGGGK